MNYIYLGWGRALSGSAHYKLLIFSMKFQLILLCFDRQISDCYVSI